MQKQEEEVEAKLDQKVELEEGGGEREKKVGEGGWSLGELVR